MRGKPLADRIRADVAEEVRGDRPRRPRHRARRRRSRLRGLHPSQAQGGERGRLRRRRTSGCPAETSEESLLARLAELNASDEVDAILVQLPLPDHIDEEHVIRAIDPAKDVDGLHPLNAGELYLGRPGNRPGDAARRDGAARRARGCARGRAAPSSSAAARSSASRWRTCCCRRTPPSPSVIHERVSSPSTHARADVLVVAVGSPGSSTPRWSVPGPSWSTSA